MKANLHWIKKLLQVSFVPAEIRPGKSRPEIYIVPPPKKKTYLFACFIGICTCGLTMSKKNKKPRENQNKKQYSRTLAKAKIQKTSRKPKKSKKTIFQDSCKSKNAKIQKTSRKPKKTKKTIFQKSGDRVNRQESWNIGFFVFFVFFWFSRSFLDFCIFTFARVLEYCFFLIFLFFFWFSRGFLDFCFCKSPGILFFFWFSRGLLNCFLLFLNFFVLEIWARV